MNNSTSDLQEYKKLLGQDPIRDIAIRMFDYINTLPNSELVWREAPCPWTKGALVIIFKFSDCKKQNIPPQPDDWDDMEGYDDGIVQGSVRNDPDFKGEIQIQFNWGGGENFASLRTIEEGLLMIKHLYNRTSSYNEMKTLRADLNEKWKIKNAHKNPELL